MLAEGWDHRVREAAVAISAQNMATVEVLDRPRTPASIRCVRQWTDCVRWRLGWPATPRCKGMPPWYGKWPSAGRSSPKRRARPAFCVP